MSDDKKFVTAHGVKFDPVTYGGQAVQLLNDEVAAAVKEAREWRDKFAQSQRALASAHETNARLTGQLQRADRSYIDLRDEYKIVVRQRDEALDELAQLKGEQS